MLSLPTKLLYLANFVSVNKQVKVMVNKNPAPITSCVSFARNKCQRYILGSVTSITTYIVLFCLTPVCLHDAVSHNFQLFFCLIIRLCSGAITI